MPSPKSRPLQHRSSEARRVAVGGHPQCLPSVPQEFDGVKVTKRWSSNSSAKSKEEKPVITPLKWYQKVTLHGAVGSFIDFLKSLIAFPLVTTEPICFEEDDRYDPAGNRRVQPVHDDDPKIHRLGERTEFGRNYERATNEMFKTLDRYRKKAKQVRIKSQNRSQPIDLKQFPEWDEKHVDKIRAIFQVFDTSADGLVDYEEFCIVLDEFGDTTPTDIRKKCFGQADRVKSGVIDFRAFLQMLYILNYKSQDNPEAQKLAKSFLRVDSSISRIRTLDLVQKLQSGLF